MSDQHSKLDTANPSINKTKNQSFQISRLIYNPSFRAMVFQILLVLTIVLIISSFVNNALQNLETRGIATGFDFMSQTAGFEIGMSLIDYESTDTYGRTFIVGLLNTALVAVIGIIFATVLGFIVGISRLSQNWLLSRAATIYIELFRNIPLLLQLLFWYIVVLQALPSARQSLELFDSFFLNVRGLYVPGFNLEPGAIATFIALAITVVIGLFIHRHAHQLQDKTGEIKPTWRYSLSLIIIVPMLVFFITGKPISIDYPELRGFNFKGGIPIIPELFALLLALSIYTASFIAEIVRSGINAVDHGQTEAASALGLPRTRMLKLIIIPQALRVIIPPLTSQYLNLVKNSSLAMAIGYPDLVSVFAGTTLNQTGQAIEIISMTMAVYLTLSLITSLLMNIYNSKTALIER